MTKDSFMKLIELVVLVCFIVIGIYILYSDINSDIGDYLQYTENPEKYQIQTVKIESIRSEYRMHTDTATIYFLDKYGVYKQDWVYVNYDENVGDYIEIAVDEHGRVIRPIITVSEGGILGYIFWLVGAIAFFRMLVDLFKGNRLWLDEL